MPVYISGVEKSGGQMAVRSTVFSKYAGEAGQGLKIGSIIEYCFNTTILNGTDFHNITLNSLHVG